MPAILNGVLDSDKIDSIAVDGLTGAADSLGYKVQEIERHFHSYELWFEAAASPSGETDIADPIGDGGGAFQIDAGNDDWGSWVQILGSNDTPRLSGSAYYDLNEVIFSAAERDEVYFVQIGFGASGATALSNGDVLEEVYKPASNLIEAASTRLHTRRQAVGTKAWARCKCPGQNTATMDFYFGLHEYEG